MSNTETRPKAPATAVQTRIRRLLEQLNQDLFEKEELVALALLSAVAGESIFLLGPPGVAKSMVARRLKYAFKEGRSFEYLMGKFSTPDEVFGPVSISKLKNEDKYERMTEYYLPGANIVFLDEIWKASPPIQNSLLTVLNEKVYRNGAQEIKVDIRGLISASNELPLKGEGLEALWDRFLVRTFVRGIQETEMFNAMITLSGGQNYGDYVADELKISNEEYQKWSQTIDYIFVPPHLLGTINNLRRNISARNAEVTGDDKLYLSDRRWRKIVRLLRASAFLNSRQEVDLMDAFLISNCIWNTAEQVEEVAQMVQQAIVTQGYRALIDLEPVRQELKELKDEISTRTTSITQETVSEKVVYTDKQEAQYYKLDKFWGEDAAYVKLGDFDKLKKDKEVFISVYELSYQTYKPFQSYSFLLKSDAELINKNKLFSFETAEKTKEIVNIVPPTQAQIISWNKIVETLLGHCSKALTVLEERKRIDFPHINKHLFVPISQVAIVKKSLEKAREEVLNLKLDIERVRHGYKTMEKS